MWPFKKRAQPTPENTMSTSMPVQYRNKHHEDRPCEREIVIPEGWELMPAGEYLDIEFSGCLIEDGDFWVPFEKSIIGAAIIRPIYARLEPYGA